MREESRDAGVILEVVFDHGLLFLKGDPTVRDTFNGDV